MSSGTEVGACRQPRSEFFFNREPADSPAPEFFFNREPADSPAPEFFFNREPADSPAPEFFFNREPADSPAPEFFFNREPADSPAPEFFFNREPVGGPHLNSFSVRRPSVLQREVRREPPPPRTGHGISSFEALTCLKAPRDDERIFVLNLFSDSRRALASYQRS
ncbi:hypothetical protein WMF20_21025 [Sorangium sp. So ce834]|uniref:hypothetical protein n=1 Tax=Sorangium sp. So ce834 TaxID=3133321 RepID=UPI003F633ED4